MPVHAEPVNKEEEITRLVEIYQASVYKTCLMYLSSPSLAEDATQETFLKAYQGLSAFKNQSHEKTWLLRIAINTCKDLRKSAWYRHTEHRFSYDDIKEKAANDEDTLSNLSWEIEQLPDKYKEVILLYYYQNMTCEETAAALRLTHSAVSRRLKHARALLKAMLEKEGIFHA